jgi:hypothetical protein
MRCDEVVRELLVPTGGEDQAAMAEHLAGCSACAEWARSVERLERLWDATRPDEPAPEAWEAVWAKIAQALPGPVAVHPDREDSPAADHSPSRNGSGPKFLVHPAPAPAPSGTSARPRGRSWRLAAMALVGLAQAAAILIALGLAWRTPERLDGPQPGAGSHIAGVPAPVAPAPIRTPTLVKVDVDVPSGHLMVIHVEEREALMVDATPWEKMNTSSDPGFVILNVLEGMTVPQVAAR